VKASKVKYEDLRPFLNRKWYTLLYAEALVVFTEGSTEDYLQAVTSLLGGPNDSAKTEDQQEEKQAPRMRQQQSFGEMEEETDYYDDEDFDEDFDDDYYGDEDYDAPSTKTPDERYARARVFFSETWQ
jgi:hypothetical protein